MKTTNIIVIRGESFRAIPCFTEIRPGYIYELRPCLAHFGGRGLGGGLVVAFGLLAIVAAIACFNKKS